MGNAIDSKWAPTTDFPTAAEWIWTPNFDYPTANPIDTPIYLRSMAPITYTVNYEPGSQSSAFVASSHPNLVLGVATPTAPAMTIPAGYTFEGWNPVVKGTVDGNVNYVAQWEKIEPEYNLWVASDDYSEVYINSNPVIVTDNDSNGHYYSQVQKYLVDATETPFVAAQAWDTKQVISGFKLVLMKDNDKGYLTTNNVDWYYYTGVSGPSIDVNGKKWFEETYVGDGWNKVTSDINPHTAWTADSQFPTAGAIWIWSPNYSGSTIDTPVYLRSMAPGTPNVPEEPGTPTTPRTPRTPNTPPVLTPIIDEPVALAPAPEVVIEDAPVALAEDPNVPQTNDSNNIFLLLGLMFASGAGITVLGRRKENAGK